MLKPHKTTCEPCEVLWSHFWGKNTFFNPLSEKVQNNTYNNVYKMNFGTIFFHNKYAFRFVYWWVETDNIFTVNGAKSECMSDIYERS